MQLSFNNSSSAAARPSRVKAELRAKLVELQQGESAVIDAIDLPQEMATRLMELGFLPGTSVEAARSAPGSGPRVFRVDGSEIALRRETADRVTVRR